MQDHMEHHGKSPRQSESHSFSTAGLHVKQLYERRTLNTSLPPKNI
jgi:hypothetical protein